MNELLEDHGKQLLRYKGVLNIVGEPRRMVFQGVLKLYGFDWDTSGRTMNRGKRDRVYCR